NARFDNWSWSLPSVAMLVLSLGITALSAWTLDRTAATARDQEIAQLRERRDRLSHDPDAEEMREVLDDLIPRREDGAKAGPTVEERVRRVLFPEPGLNAATGIAAIRQGPESDRVTPPDGAVAGHGSAPTAGTASTVVAMTGRMIEAKPGTSSSGPDP